MLKHLLAVLAIAGALISPASSLEPTSAVFVSYPITKKISVMGSGVHIGGGVYLSAVHVVEKSKGEVTFTDELGRPSKGTVAWVAPRYDIAMLLGRADRPASELACRPAKLEEPVTIQGNPLDMRFIRTHGTIAGDSPKEGKGPRWPESYIIDATSAPGNSGGPVYDVYGKVIGILVGGYSGFPFAIAVPSATVCNLLGRPIVDPQ